VKKIDELLPQLEEMVKSGRKPKEVKKHFKDVYNLDVPSWKIANMRYKFFGGKGKRVKKEKPVIFKDASIEQVAVEIVKLLKQIDAGYKGVFLHLRLELIKSRNEVFMMNKSIGKDLDTEGIE
jgi:hypothetical protein